MTSGQLAEGLRYLVEVAQRAREPLGVEVPGDGRVFFNQNMYPVAPVTADELKVRTLGAVVDYLNNMLEELDTEGSGLPFVYIQSPTIVRVVSHLRAPYLIRHTYVKAEFVPPPVRANTEIEDIESFLLTLQAAFVRTPEVDNILKVLGNLKDEKVTTYADDGVTQRVTTAASLTRSEPASVPNPVWLQQYRTFPEVEQPASQYVLRLKAPDKVGMPLVKLIAADNRAWEIEAIHNIAAWLGDKIVNTKIEIIG